ncbi:hypothetical protein PULV_a1509 [Pseudoalteromonas ulvae UL12]|nr:hypothetical protein [Pseudoalteromonas ulvae UL12]
MVCLNLFKLRVVLKFDHFEIHIRFLFVISSIWLHECLKLLIGANLIG